jgi:hypothetical protein
MAIRLLCKLANIQNMRCVYLGRGLGHHTQLFLGLQGLAHVALACNSTDLQNRKMQNKNE